ncbi:hypothetical protein WA158_007717 [Blastocystis sp. Blastoise]
MSTTEFQLTEDKYLFTFQDETQLWISKEFIDKYQQFPFQDIIEHSEKYEDGSYYIDMPSFSMNKVIDFLMEENIDISSLNLKDSYDIYKTLVEYSVTLDKEIQSDLLFHVKELFYEYLKDNNYNINGSYDNYIDSTIPMELFNLEEKKIIINGLFTPKRKDELLYYSLLFKMMNITNINITYDYASDIPLEYICPSCIKDIFPSLKELKITVNMHYKKTDQLLNPNSDEYIMEYNRLFSINEYEIEYSEEYECYTESEMKKYNKISSLDPNKLYYSHNLIDTIAKRREKNEIPKLYKYLVNEAMYTNDYSKVEISKTEDEYELDDKVRIKYDDLYDQIDPIFFMKLFEEGIFDSLTTLSINTIKLLINEIDKNLFNKIITTHVFPNVTELIYDDDDDATENFKSIFPVNLISIIDTIRIRQINTDQKQTLAPRLDHLAYTYSIHIDIIDIDIDDLNYFPHLNELLERNLISFDKFSFKSFHSENIKILDSIGNYKHNIDSLNITFKNNNLDEIDKRNSLERFLNSSVLQHLNDLTILFDKNINIECLEWISTLFKNNKFNTIHKLTIDSLRNTEDLSFEYFSTYEDILEKLIPKASIVAINDHYMSFKSQLIPKGCFHNTTQLIIGINDILDDKFFKLYTTDNFPQLKTIMFYKKGNIEWYSSFIKIFCTYINNNNFPSSSIVRLGECENSYCYDYVYYPNTSILRCKYDTNSFMNTIISNKDIYDEEQLSKLISFITIGKFPKLKYISFICDISYEQIEIYKQQLKDSTFIQENHVDYKFDTFY